MPDKHRTLIVEVPQGAVEIHRRADGELYLTFKPDPGCGHLTLTREALNEVQRVARKLPQP